MPPKRRTKATTAGKKAQTPDVAAVASARPASPMANHLMTAYPLVEALSWRTRTAAAAIKLPSGGTSAREWLEDFKARLKKVQLNPVGEELILPPTASTRKRVLPPSARRISVGKRPRLSGHPVNSPVSTKLPIRKKITTSANRTQLNSPSTSQVPATPTSDLKSRPRRKAAVEATKRLTANRLKDPSSNSKPRTTGRRKKSTTVTIIDVIDIDIEIDSVEDSVAVNVPVKQNNARGAPNGSGRAWPASEPVSPVQKPIDETIVAPRMSQMGGPVTSTPKTDSSTTMMQARGPVTPSSNMDPSMTMMQSFHTACTYRGGEVAEQEPSSGSSENGFLTALPNQGSQQKTLMEELEAAGQVQTGKRVGDMMERDLVEDEEMPEDIPAVGDVSMAVIEPVSEEDVRIPVVMKTDVMPARAPSGRFFVENQPPGSSKAEGSAASSEQMKPSTNTPRVVITCASSVRQSTVIKLTSTDSAGMEASRESGKLSKSRHTSVSKAATEIHPIAKSPEILARSFINVKNHGTGTAVTETNPASRSSTHPPIISQDENGITSVSPNDSEWEAEGDDEADISVRKSPICPKSKAIRPVAKRNGRRSCRSKKSSTAPVLVPVVRPRDVSVSRDNNKSSLPANPTTTSPGPSSQSPRRPKRDGSVNASAAKAEEAARRRDEGVRMKGEELKKRNEERLRKAHEKRDEVERQRQAKVAEQLKHDQASDKHRQDLDLQKQARLELNRQRAVEAEKRRVDEAERNRKQAQERLNLSPLAPSSAVKAPSKGHGSAVSCLPVGEPSRTPPRLPVGPSTAKSSALPGQKVPKPVVTGSKIHQTPQIDPSGVQAAKQYILNKAGGSTVKPVPVPPAVPSLAELRNTASKDASSSGGDRPRTGKSPTMPSRKKPSPLVSGASSIDSGMGRSISKDTASSGPSASSAVDGGLPQPPIRHFPTAAQILEGGYISSTSSVNQGAAPSSSKSSPKTQIHNATFNIAHTGDTSVKVAPSIASTKPQIITQSTINSATANIVRMDLSVKIPVSSSQPTTHQTTKTGASIVKAPIAGSVLSGASTSTSVIPKPSPVEFSTGPVTEAQAAFPVPRPPVAASVKEVKPFTSKSAENVTNPPAKPVIAAKKTSAPPPKPVIASYGLDIEQDDDTDDEERPRKEVPLWAQKDRLTIKIREQLSTERDLDFIFKGVRPSERVKLHEIFKADSSRYNRRTSSQMWPSGVLPLGIHTPLGGRMAKVTEIKLDDV